MNITAENFEKSFEAISEAVKQSHFIAIDCEFTGLRLPDAARERPTDSLEARYQNARSSASSFMLTQYGVCCFRYDNDGVLEARPFNCFIFPSTEFRTDRVFSCQASSMEFLSKNRFDFTAWVTQGVPFLSRQQEATIVRKREERRAREEADAAASAATAMGPAQDSAAADVARDGTTLESMEQAERDLITNARKKAKALVEEASSGGKYVERSATLDPMNGRQRWLMYEFVGNHNSSIKLSNLSGPSYAKGIEIRTVPSDPKQRAIEEAKARDAVEEKQKQATRMAVGFRRVIDEISEAGKPVIAHNGLLDLLHTYDKFVGPLPAHQEDGAKALHSLLPRLFDSKVAMSSAANAGIAFPRTRLGDAFHWLCETYAKKKEPEAAAATTATSTKDSAVTARSDGDNVAPAGATEATNGTDDKAAVTSVGEQNPPAVEGNGAGAGEAAEMEETEKPTWRAATFAPGFGKRYADGGQEHEAAYDAYLTGVCFAAAVTLGLGVGVEELKAMGSGGDVPTQLRPVLNVLPLYRMLADQKLCLPGPTPPPDYSRMVHVSGFPSEAKTDAVIRPLASVNGLGSVRFHWIDDTSGVAECKSSEAARVLLLAGAAARQKLQAAAGGEGVAVVSEAKTDVDPIKLSLGDLCIGTLESLTRNGVEPGEKLQVKVDGAAQASAVIVEDDVRGKKRPRDEENGGETGAGD